MENHFSKRVGVTPSEADDGSVRPFISAGSGSEEGPSWLLELIFVCLCGGGGGHKPIQICVEETPDIKRR